MKTDGRLFEADKREFQLDHEMETLHLFNANPVPIGRGMNGPAEFSDAASLVAHLDYLGIERSLVYHQTAFDINPTSGNLRLMEEIKPYSQRLTPAFVVSPHLVFEREGLDTLRRALDEWGVRALRIFPQSFSFRPHTLARLLGEIRQFKPVVFMRLGESDPAEFVALAERFPDLKFVITEFMWGGMAGVLDMLWRCRNILAELSWNHVENGIEAVTNDFGPERSLFGFRLKSDYGGSVAALAHARIDEAVRRRVAGGTLQDLLGLDPFAGKIETPAIMEKKPLWKVFRQGGILKGVEIIDAHGHSGPTTGWSFVGSSIQPGLYVQKLLDILDRNGVQKLIVSHFPALKGDALEGNLEIEAACLKHARGRINGYVVFNPNYKDALLPELDGFFSRGFFVGFKTLASYWKVPLTDPRYIPAWEYANRHRLPILLHTWDGPYDTPSLLKDIVPKYPDATFLLGHSGGGTGGRFEAVDLAKANKNVMLEFCGSFTTNVDYADAIKELGIGRIVFGSDMDGHNQAWELGRFLSLPFPDDEIKPALADNMKKILAEVK